MTHVIIGDGWVLVIHFPRARTNSRHSNTNENLADAKLEHVIDALSAIDKQQQFVLDLEHIGKNLPLPCKVGGETLVQL